MQSAHVPAVCRVEQALHLLDIAALLFLSLLFGLLAGHLGDVFELDDLVHFSKIVLSSRIAILRELPDEKLYEASPNVQTHAET